MPKHPGKKSRKQNSPADFGSDVAITPIGHSTKGAIGMEAPASGPPRERIVEQKGGD